MLNYYEQITNNKRQSFGIIFLFLTFIIGSVYLISQATNNPELVPIAILFSAGSSLVSFFAGDKIVLALNGAIPATRKKYFNFYTVTENLSMAAKIPLPQIYVIESNAMNAFATGRNPDHAVICATTGLLSKLNRTELEGVIAHELSHIKNYDIRLMTIVSILIGTLSILINMSWRTRFRSSDDNNKSGGIFMIIGLILIIFAPIIAQLIQLAISRRREFFADASAIAITHQPSGLISALKKLSTDNSPSDFASTATASLYITNPFKGNKLASMFSSHPPISDRIKTLEAML
ncbi:zinc metalloprotease HtpX [Candidatus Shapirobacteria bacterium CG2_30_35_20]|uniref:Protease HtpX homolog n=3 Tax=Candidatus Shapironibacteriota TaxID=1752721 RepID=A0A1J5HSI0_9BACT|nr:MAG: zinc metalloprotease HtpX [Candidatus Shapirobacteria bacterium CG2_30_35_20]PIV07149.1 MAG: zinc metalloprotease HtpX [Candidatus Shapirobacteria bacterium CG03_land_8_20_14_0_80_35_14]